MATCPDCNYLREEVAELVPRLDALRQRLREHGAQWAFSVRHGIGLSQAEMARRLGVTNVHLCYVENAKSVLSIELAERIAAMDAAREGRGT